MKKLLAAFMLMTTFTASAGDFEDGMAAFEKEDYATAIAKFTTAAEQGDALAQFNIGIMYDEGLGVTQDYAQAVRWYQLAADQNFIDAQYNLAVMYDEGLGVTQDYAKAAHWYKLAAEQGDVDAQFNLGVMYDVGEGVVQNDIQAHMWFNLAAAQGDVEAMAERDLVAKQMTPEQLAEAQKLATECQARQYKRCD